MAVEQRVSAEQTRCASVHEYSPFSERACTPSSDRLSSSSHLYPLHHLNDSTTSSCCCCGGGGGSAGGGGMDDTTNNPSTSTGATSTAGGGGCAVAAQSSSSCCCCPSSGADMVLTSARQNQLLSSYVSQNLQSARQIMSHLEGAEAAGPSSLRRKHACSSSSTPMDTGGGCSTPGGGGGSGSLRSSAGRSIPGSLAAGGGVTVMDTDDDPPSGVGGIHSRHLRRHNDDDDDGDVEDSVDDILDGLPLCGGRGDSMERLSSSGGREEEDEDEEELDGGGLDDIDMDMDMEQDQVDSGCGGTNTTTTTTTSGGVLGYSGSRLGSVSARGCLETSASSSKPSSLGGVPCGGGGGYCPHHQHPQHPHVGGLLLQDDDELMSLGRPMRTSSVGSKPELIRRKNSAPMLGISCASRSWSDTSGSYFRNLFNPRFHEKQKEGHMLLDFTKNHKSYDHIAPGYTSSSTSQSQQQEDGAKEKKSLSIERIKNTFSKHRSSCKLKGKRVSEGDATSSSYSRGGGIEIPSVHGDYFPMDFNPSPRSNNSNTSTNSDVPLAGYLQMRPGPSLSYSSTGSTDYVDMGRGGSGSSGVAGGGGGEAATDCGYVEMSSPRCSMDPIYHPTVAGSVSEGYVDMTHGAGGLSISADSSSSSSSTSRVRKISNTFSHVSSVEFPSPQEELPEFSYLYEMDTKSLQKEKKKSRKRSSKESSKRKKSDPGTGDSVAETLRSKGSGHLASFTHFLTRKNSQSSSIKTPLSPTGSPLPKAIRSSNSPFASLGRSKSRESSNPPPVSQSPTTPGGTLGILTGTQMSQMSPSNLHEFLHSTFNPSFRDSDTLENENYCAVDGPVLPSSQLASSSGSGGTFPRNHSNKDLASLRAPELSLLPGNRASGSYDLSPGALLGGGGGLGYQASSCAAIAASPCCGNHASQSPQCGEGVCSCGGGAADAGARDCNHGHCCHHHFPHQHHHHHQQQQCQHHQQHSQSCELKDRGGGSSGASAGEEGQQSYVNLCVRQDFPSGSNRRNSSTSSNSNSLNSANSNSSGCRHSASSRLSVSGDKLGQNDNSLATGGRPPSELGRLSESSLEDGGSGSNKTAGASGGCSSASASASGSSSSAMSPNTAQDTASYVNMCPSANKKNSLVMVDERGSGTPGNDRKILNTEQMKRCNQVAPLPPSPATSKIAATGSSDSSSDYLEMDIRKSGSAVSTPTPPRVVKRPALPPLLLSAGGGGLLTTRSDPSVPLEKLSLTEQATTTTSSNCWAAPNSSSYNSNCKTSCHLDSNTCCSGTTTTTSIHDPASVNERCRSHSGPGAPEASRFGGGSRSRETSCGSGGLDVCEEVGRRGGCGGEGESRALSACSSPLSYSPPTSPSLASSSKSSLSEGGMSSASSTCTVVNVGLRLQQQQQQQQRQSHGSGSSSNTDTHSSSGAPSTPLNPIGSTIIGSTSSSSCSNASHIPENTTSLSGKVSGSSGVGTASTSSSAAVAGTSSSGGYSRPACATISQDTATVGSLRGGGVAAPDIVYACLDLAPPKRDIIHSCGGAGGSSGSNSPASKRRVLSGGGCSAVVTTTTLAAAATGLATSATAACSPTSTCTSAVAAAAAAKSVGGGVTGTSQKEEGSSSTSSSAAASECPNYTEIDFKKSESLRNTCMMRDGLRH